MVDYVWLDGGLCVVRWWSLWLDGGLYVVRWWTLWLDGGLMKINICCVTPFHYFPSGRVAVSTENKTNSASIKIEIDLRLSLE